MTPLSAPFRIATRRSKLAVWQAQHVAEHLRLAHAGLDVELVQLTTQGDRILDRAVCRHQHRFRLR